MAKTLTAERAVSFGLLVDAIQHSRKVTWLLEGMAGPLTGTLRHLTPAEDSAMHAPSNVDIRTCWVRITTVQGWETWVQLEDLATGYREGAVSIAD